MESVSRLCTGRAVAYLFLRIYHTLFVLKEIPLIKETLKHVVKHGIMIVFSIFVALLISETSLRALNVSYPVFHVFDYERGKGLMPEKKGWWRSEGDAYVEINKAGFRDTEHSLKKPDGTYRIAVIGDSYVEARHVALEDTFGKRLEKKLATCNRLSDREVEVLNFGVSGYGTAEELLTLRHRAWAYDPDLVLTTFFSGNDLRENFPQAYPELNTITHRAYFYFDREGLKLNTSFRDWSPDLFKYRLLLWGVHHSHTLELVNHAMRVIDAWKIRRNSNHAFRETMLSEFTFAPPQTPVHQQAWALTEAILTLMHKEVIEHGAKFLLVTVTSPNQMDPEQRRLVKNRLGVKTLDYPERRLSSLGAKVGFPVFNLLYDFQRYADQTNVHLHGFPNTRLGSGHWNEKGHELAATLIDKKICNDPSFH